jgi:hypothetical protein
VNDTEGVSFNMEHADYCAGVLDYHEFSPPALSTMAGRIVCCKTLHCGKWQFRWPGGQPRTAQQDNQRRNVGFKSSSDFHSKNSFASVETFLAYLSSLKTTASYSFGLTRSLSAGSTFSLDV